MITANDVQFGRLEPKGKKQFDNGRYSWSVWLPVVSAGVAVEKAFPLPANLHANNNQGRTNGCTGWASVIWQSIVNSMEANEPQFYDGDWIYHEGQLTDNDPETDPARDNGGYLWAVWDVARKEGQRQVVNSVSQPVKLENGILSYVWARTIDEMRSAFAPADGSPPRPVNFGIPWYEEFMTPRTVNGEFWIGTRAKWGSLLGGHSITAAARSDSRQAFKLINSWGDGYPDVWISDASIMRLMGDGGECAVPLDRPLVAPIPPPPPPEPTAHKLAVDITVDAKPYHAEWN